MCTKTLVTQSQTLDLKRKPHVCCVREIGNNCSTPQNGGHKKFLWKFLSAIRPPFAPGLRPSVYRIFSPNCRIGNQFPNYATWRELNACYAISGIPGPLWSPSTTLDSMSDSDVYLYVRITAIGQVSEPPVNIGGKHQQSLTGFPLQLWQHVKFVR